jgi:hypothetical protein
LEGAVLWALLPLKEDPTWGKSSGGRSLDLYPIAILTCFSRQNF